MLDILYPSTEPAWLSGRVSACESGGCGFDPQPGHTKRR